MKPVDKERFPSLDKVQRKNIAVLEERHRYLTERLDSGDCSERARSFLKDERVALGWALGEVTALHSSEAPS